MTTGKKTLRRRTTASAKTRSSARTRRVAPVAKEAPRSAAKSASTAGADRAHAKPEKQKSKPVRDSFTMPQPDFDLIGVLKERAIAFKRPAKKSELLRAGLHALAAMSDAKLHASLDALAPIKSGRPKKS
jgi:hypothetical protein